MRNAELNAVKAAILERWREAIIATYPVEARRYLQDNRSRFSNPIGLAVEQASAEVLDYIFAADGAALNCEALIDLIRIRGVQDWTASQAVGFIDELRDIIHRHLWSPVYMQGRTEVYFRWLRRLDAVELAAFDIYVAQREKLADIRVDEFRRRYAKIIERSGKFESERVRK
ncbi:MAG: hypothetical protein FJY65_00120 [Calditrichaeota bacterium]|nr:hypothetical protein [Calditrichota bacterium]